MDDYIDRVEAGGVDTVAGQDAGGDGALQRGETEDGIAIMAEDELGETVAESADAVIEENGRGHGLWKTLAA